MKAKLYFCKLIISLIGYIRRHSSESIKLEIDSMVNRSVSNNIIKIVKY